jgi:glycosyltransferase involved in cell wall biosynthesis
MKRDITFIHSGLVFDVQSLRDEVNKVSTGLVCITTHADQLEKEKLLQAMDRVDVLHCGLLFHEGKPFESVQLCAFNWHFINPQASVRSISWKPSIEFMVFAKEDLTELGGFDSAYKQPVSVLCDFAFRVLLQGGIVTHDPDFAPAVKSSDSLDVLSSCHDEARFVRKFINEGAYKYFRLCNFLLTGKWVMPSKPLPFIKGKLCSSKLFSPAERKDLKNYTAIIPTINRYDYIVKSISSLLNLEVPPADIIVIDQSPSANRQTNIYSEYEQSGKVKVIYLDTPGQSTARNVGIEAARSPWILLFEDDAEAWPEMVNEHIKLLESTQADVSTGVVVIPGQDESFIPEVNRFYFISDILTTGNAFLSKKTAQSVNGFDPAFNRGPGADDDFGKRLYINGNVIVYNYKSIETHYKAPQGGMREHGVWWRNTSTLLGPFPPVTQLYSIRKYYSRRYRFFLIITLLLKAKKKHSFTRYIFLWILLPIKYIKSWKATVTLERQGRGE